MSELIGQQVSDLPNEVLLHVFRFFPLKVLIIGRTVSQDWRRLIPLADISPIRRTFLGFYLTLVSSPIFPQTRPWVLANLQPFDRQAYIDGLMRQHPYVPETFRVWILEWPARAVIGCVWPGLPNLYSRGPCVDNVHRIEGTNWLAPVPRRSVPYHFRTVLRKPNSFLRCSSSTTTTKLPSGSCSTREILFGTRFILSLKVVMSSGTRRVRRNGMTLMRTGSDGNDGRGTISKRRRGKELRKTNQSSSLRQCHQPSLSLNAGTTPTRFCAINFKHILGSRGMIPRCRKYWGSVTCVSFPLYFA